VAVTFDTSLDGIDWEQAKADLAADRFDNGRTAGALRRSFAQSQHVAFARDGDRDDQQAFYASLGYEPQPEFLSLVAGRWLDNEANR
jgi:hypothetical protein